MSRRLCLVCLCSHLDGLHSPQKGEGGGSVAKGREALGSNGNGGQAESELGVHVLLWLTVVLPLCAQDKSTQLHWEEDRSR